MNIDFDDDLHEKELFVLVVRDNYKLCKTNVMATKQNVTLSLIHI